MSQETKQPEPPVRAGWSDEQLALHRWRYRQARHAGMSTRDAQLFADSKIDIEEMRALARSGYPPDGLLLFLLD